MNVGRIFSSGGQQWIFPAVAKRNFSRGPTVINFHFTTPKLSEKQLTAKKLKAKYQTSKFRGGKTPLPPPPRPMVIM